MADYTSFLVVARNQSAIEQKLGAILCSDIVVHNFRGGKVRFVALTEGTISAVNTGAVTDTIVVVDDASLFTIARSALFNATVQNEAEKEQMLVGFLVLIDHTITSPDTDSGNVRMRFLFRHRSGAAPTYAQAGYGRKEMELDSFKILEGAGIGAVPYAGPFILPLNYPIKVERNESIIEHLGCFTVLWRNTAEFPTFTAHSVATTYTFKVAGYAVLVDLSIIANYKSLDEFWAEFTAGGN